jgi:hypothetical protein
MYQHKSLLNGKTGIALLTNKPGLCFKVHNSADAIAICMLLLQ